MDKPTHDLNNANTFFIIPSSFRRGELSVAVSTSGTSPAFAKKIRAKLEKNIGMEYAYLLSLIAEIRYEIKKKSTQGELQRPGKNHSI